MRHEPLDASGNPAMNRRGSARADAAMAMAMAPASASRPPRPLAIAFQPAWSAAAARTTVMTVIDTLAPETCLGIGGRCGTADRVSLMEPDFLGQRERGGSHLCPSRAPRPGLCSLRGSALRGPRGRCGGLAE